MAVDLCSETSPRISFSHDLKQTNILPLIQPDSSLLDPEFEFEISNIFEQKSSSADELFSHGFLLPTQIHERTETPKHPNPEPQQSISLIPSPFEPSIAEDAAKENSKEAVVKSIASEEKSQNQSKSFWNFKRSSSLNHEGKKGLICSLQLLSRSHSTGSSSSLHSKKSMPSKENNNQKKQSSSKYPLPKSSSLSSVTSAKYNFSAPQSKPQSKWSYGGTSASYGRGGRLSPVLNVPSPYISNAATSLFGFGSLFYNTKDKKSKKRSQMVSRLM